MKLNEPIGNSLYAPLFIRASLGTYFIIAGYSKLHQINAFVEEIKAFNILPDYLATLYGLILPYLEIIAGILILLGIWTTLGAIIASLLLISIVIAFGFLPGTGKIFNKDVILLCASLSLLYSGAGAYSVDSFRKNS